MLAKLLVKYLSPKVRYRIAAVILDLSVLGWPLSALTVAKGEPPFILGLSWLAITITAFDVLCTTDVRNTQEETPAESAQAVCRNCGCKQEG